MMKKINPTSVYFFLLENKAELLHVSKTQISSGGMNMHRTVHRLADGKIFVDEQTHNTRLQRVGTVAQFSAEYPYIEIQ